MRTYDESSVLQRLAQLDRRRKTAFAVACAERLSPLYLRYAEVVPSVDVIGLATIVQQVWEVLRGAQVDLRPQQEMAEALVPVENNIWVLETAYAQNAAASTGYAVRAWLTDDAQQAAWAARQAYEASDYAAQQLLPDLQLNAPDAEHTLAGHEIVQSALDAIERDLQAVEAQELDVDGLLARAISEGIAWSQGMP